MLLYKISVIVPTYNRKDILRQCIEALLAQNCNQDEYEIIVIDDGSSDGTENILESFKNRPNFSFFRQKNSGPASARNKGAEISRGRNLLFVDDDVIATRDLISSHISLHERQSNIAVLGYTPFAAQSFTNLNVKYYSLKWEKFFEAASRSHCNVPYRFFMTLNISIEKSVFFELGGFDMTFKRADYEDTEFGYRHCKAGYKIFFSKEAKAFHLYHTTFKLSCERKFRSGALVARLHKKYPQLSDDFLLKYIRTHIVIDNEYEEFAATRIVCLRSIFINRLFLGFIKGIGPIFQRLLPQEQTFKLYRMIESYFFLLGFKVEQNLLRKENAI